MLEYVKANVHPLDIVFRLAEEHGIVLLNGGGFAAPNWSARVSFANLDDEAYANIGRAVRAVATGYVREYEAAKRERWTHRGAHNRLVCFVPTSVCRVSLLLGLCAPPAGRRRQHGRWHVHFGERRSGQGDGYGIS